MTTPLVYTIPEAAEMLKVSERTMQMVVSRGEIPTVRLGRCVRIPHHELVAFIEERAARNYPKAATA